MKKVLLLSVAMAGLFFAPLFADIKEPAGFVLFFDAGVPIKGAEGRYGADFGKSFLDIGAQMRLTGNFFVEGSFAFSPAPRPNDPYFYKSDGFELAMDAVWKFAALKKINPFVKIGLSYAWISSNNAWQEIYYPDAGRETNRWWGLNAGGGVEYKLGGLLLLRLGGTFTLVPNDGEGAVASWGKLFAGIGFRI